MIFELAKDFHDAGAVIPREHPKHRMFELLEEAIRHDIHFLARHLTTLFQSMWNTCGWYDCARPAQRCETSTRQSQSPTEDVRPPQRSVTLGH